MNSSSYCLYLMFGPIILFSVCLFFHRREDSEAIIEAYTKIFGRLKLNILFAHGKKDRIPKHFLFFRYYQKQITLSFSKEP